MTRTIGARVPEEMFEAFEVLADRHTQKLGRTVTLSEVVRAMLDSGIATNPVDDIERGRLRKKKARGAAKLELGARGRLRALERALRRAA